MKILMRNGFSIDSDFNIYNKTGKQIKLKITQ